VSPDPDSGLRELAPRTARRLRLANLGLALLHGGQAAVLLALTTDFVLPVTQTFPEGPPGTAAPAPEALLEPRLGVLVAGFLLLAALDHLVVALPRVHRTYEGLLARSRNPFRWAEYSVSASLMVVLIGFLAGVSDVTAVVAVIGANAAMIGFGHRSERVNEGRTAVEWQPFVLGCLVGLVPWLAIGVNIAGAELQAEGEGVPTFVYAIFVSLFVLFSSFAVVQYLQLRARPRGGRWADPVRAEVGYLVLSLVAKSALAWQVFANVLVEPGS
jgi:hypothetical protein